MAKSFFGHSRNIEHSCRHCEFGRLSFDGEIVFCRRKGLVNPASICRKYKYSPFHRVPRPPAQFDGQFSQEDFSLDMGGSE